MVCTCICGEYKTSIISYPRYYIAKYFQIILCISTNNKSLLFNDEKLFYLLPSNISLCVVRFAGCVNYFLKAINFRMFKLNFERENYLINQPSTLWIPLCTFIRQNHRLPLENFRQNLVNRNLRHCTLCHINEVGDEFLYVFKCVFFLLSRECYY